MEDATLTVSDIKAINEINEKVQKLDEISLAKVQGFVACLSTMAGETKGSRQKQKEVTV